MHVTRKLAALGAAVMASTALAVVPATSASAADTCSNAGFQVFVPYGLSNGDPAGYYEAYYCNNITPVSVYQFPDRGQTVGFMYERTNWYACQINWGDFNGESGSHARRWLFTLDDTGQWGWVADSDIYSETDPVPTC
jgi:hypothetical protein